ncbi:hypothetical protein PMEGAPL103_51020 [Priestia megaterium]
MFNSENNYRNTHFGILRHPLCSNILYKYTHSDKGKLVEKLGRKATGLKSIDYDS